MAPTPTVPSAWRTIGPGRSPIGRPVARCVGARGPLADRQASGEHPCSPNCRQGRVFAGAGTSCRSAPPGSPACPSAGGSSTGSTSVRAGSSISPANAAVHTAYRLAADRRRSRCTPANAASQDRGPAASVPPSNWSRLERAHGRFSRLAASTQAASSFSSSSVSRVEGESRRVSIGLRGRASEKRADQVPQGRFPHRLRGYRGGIDVAVAVAADGGPCPSARGCRASPGPSCRPDGRAGDRRPPPRRPRQGGRGCP